ncbi:MAG: AbrB/MazE/SpoVT family DNA-binding domain-containing protein [bacterium]|nr:AbrB/MazE/SpoVT family DNA-binding domain-containing protein [bacterium]
MLQLKIRKIGNSFGIVLPREALAHLHIQEGDTVFLTETPDDGYKLTPYDPDFDRKMRQAEDIMHRYRNTLRALAE